jgi:hypothetical protein
VTNRLEPQAEYYPADDTPKLVAAVVDVETTGTKPDSDKIIELHVVADHAGAFGDGRHDRAISEWLPRSKARKVRFALDSPLEEAVSSEPVSESLKFPVSRENTGNFIDSRLRSASTAAKKGIKPEPYGPIPYASEQGIFCGLAGNLNRRSGKFPP